MREPKNGDRRPKTQERPDPVNQDRKPLDLMPVPKFSADKMRELEGKVTDSGKEILAKMSFNLFDAIDLYSNRSWHQGVRIVGVTDDGGKPKILVATAAPNGVDFFASKELDLDAFTRCARKPKHNLIKRPDGYPQPVVEPKKIKKTDRAEQPLAGNDQKDTDQARADLLATFAARQAAQEAAAAEAAAAAVQQNTSNENSPEPIMVNTQPIDETPRVNEPASRYKADTITPEEERTMRLRHLLKMHGGIYENKPQKMDIRIVDLSAWIEQLAELVAENKLRAYMNRKGVGAIFSKAFAHINEDAYRRKFYLDALHAIESNRNLKASLEARVFGRGAVESTDPHTRETLAQFDDVLRHFADDLHDEEERGDQFVADETLNNAASALFVEYATGGIGDRTAFEKRVEEEIIPLMGGKKFAQGGRSTASERENRMHASNLFHWAETYKEQVSHMITAAQEKYGEKDPESIKRYVKGMLKLDLNIELSKRGRDVVERDPAGKMSRGERAVSWLQNMTGSTAVNKVLGAVVANPVTMGIVGAIAARAGVRWAATGAAAMGIAGAGVLSGPAAVIAAGLVGGTLAAGLFAKIRASKELKQDRGMVARDRALGRTPGGPRAEKMSEFVQEMKNADTILEQLRAITGQETNPEARAAALTLIAETHARLEVRLQHAKDTINVSAEEGERDLSLANAIDDIKRQFQRLGRESNLMKDPSLAGRVDAEKQKILDDIAARDTAFAEYLSKNSNRKALIGGSIGLASGALMWGARHVFHDQLEAAGNYVLNGASNTWSATKRLLGFNFGGPEMPPAAPAAVHGGLFSFMDAPRGVHEVPFEKGILRLPSDRIFVSDGHGGGRICTLFGKPVSPLFHMTPDGKVLEADAMSEWGGHIEHVTQNVPGHQFSGTLRPVEFGNHAVTNNFEIPDNMDIKPNVDGTFDITDKTGRLIEGGIQVGPDGKLLPASAALLRQHGWMLREEVHIDKTSYTRDGLTKFLREHMGQSKAHRLDWHSNGTPMHKVGAHWVVTDKTGDLPMPKGPNTLGPHSFKVDSWPDPKYLHQYEADPHFKVEHVGGRWVGADGKELQLKLDGTSSARTLSIKEMIKNAIGGKVNSDGSIDNKFGDISNKVESKAFAEAASKFRLRVFVGQNYWHSGESFELPVGPDGVLNIKPGDELYNVLFDDHGDLKATVEAVIPSDDGAGYHTLATATRHGDGAGVVAHRSSLFRLMHSNKDVTQDFYDWQETPATIPSAPTSGSDDIPFIFPIPWTPRDPMEVPKLDEQSKQKGERTPRGPLTPEMFKAQEELSRKLVESADFDTVLSGKHEQTGRQYVEDAQFKKWMDGAVDSYVASNKDNPLSSNDPEIIREKLTEARAREIREPLKWGDGFVFNIAESGQGAQDGGFSFEGVHGGVHSIDEFEQRLAVAKPRPELLMIAVSAASLAKHQTTEQLVAQVFGPEFTKKFAAYGVAVKFVSEKSLRNGVVVTPPDAPPEKEYQVLALRGERIEALPVRQQLVGVGEFDGNQFKQMEVARLAAGTQTGTQEPVVYVLDESYVQRMIGKKVEGRAEIKTTDDAVAFFTKNIEKLIQHVARETGERVMYRVIVGGTNVDAITNELRESMYRVPGEGEIARQRRAAVSAREAALAAERAAPDAQTKLKPEIKPIVPDLVETRGPGEGEILVRQVFEHTDSTKGKGKNEDSQFIDRANEVYGMFDGMGGYAGGKEASTFAAEAFQKRAAGLRDVVARGGSAKELSAALDQAFADVQAEVVDNLRNAGLPQGGTTAAIAIPFMENNKAYAAVAAVGDSRVYVLDDKNRLTPLTSDLITRTTPASEISAKWAIEQRMRTASSSGDLLSEEVEDAWGVRNVIGSYLGIGSGKSGRSGNNFAPNIRIIELPAGVSRLLLMTDGVGDNLTDFEIIETVIDNSADPARALVEEAAARSKEKSFRSKPDDISAAVIELGPKAAPVAPVTDVAAEISATEKPEESIGRWQDNPSSVRFNLTSSEAAFDGFTIGKANLIGRLASHIQAMPKKDGKLLHVAYDDAFLKSDIMKGARDRTQIGVERRIKKLLEGLSPDVAARTEVRALKLPNDADRQNVVDRVNEDVAELKKKDEVGS